MYDLQDARPSRRKTIALQLNAWGVTCGVLIPVVIFVYQGVVSLVVVIFSASLISRLIDPDRPQTTAMG